MNKFANLVLTPYKLIFDYNKRLTLYRSLQSTKVLKVSFNLFIHNRSIYVYSKNIQVI